LSGATFDAYEIRHGLSFPTVPPGSTFTPGLRSVLAENSGWQQGQTLAIYLHGLFESPRVMRALFGEETPTLDDTLDGLADFVDRHFAPGTLMALLK
jgi:adenosylcobyric acid synthase